MSHFYTMEYMYWPRLSELCIGHISMLCNSDPGSLNYSWVTFLCYGILTQALWIIARWHSYAMEYWPRLSELYLGQISMLWNADPGSPNYSKVVFLWLSEISWVTYLCYGILTQALWIIGRSHFYAMEYWPWNTVTPNNRLHWVSILWHKILHDHY